MRKPTKKPAVQTKTNIVPLHQDAASHPSYQALLFDRKYYENENPDVVATGMDPAAHYRQHGYREFRAPNKLFNPRAYLLANSDLRDYDGDLFLHYIFYGAAEGRPLR